MGFSASLWFWVSNQAHSPSPAPLGSPATHTSTFRGRYCVELEVSTLKTLRRRLSDPVIWHIVLLNHSWNCLFKLFVTWRTGITLSLKFPMIKYFVPCCGSDILTRVTLWPLIHWLIQLIGLHFSLPSTSKTERQCHHTALLQLSFSRELKLLHFCSFKVSNILESLEKMESISAK